MTTFYPQVDIQYLKKYFKEYASYGHWYPGMKAPDVLPNLGDQAELVTTDGVTLKCTVVESNGLRVSLKPHVKP